MLNNHYFWFFKQKRYEKQLLILDVDTKRKTNKTLSLFISLLLKAHHQTGYCHQSGSLCNQKKGPILLMLTESLTDSVALSRAMATKEIRSASNQTEKALLLITTFNVEKRETSKHTVINSGEMTMSTF